MAERARLHGIPSPAAMRLLFALATLAVSVVPLTGCWSARAVNTLPPPASARAETVEHVLDLPEGLEVRWVDYDAALAGNVSGAINPDVPTAVTTSLYGRAFVKVFAVERATGEEVLLVYDNIAQRSAPARVIRFRRPAAERAER